MTFSRFRSEVYLCSAGDHNIDALSVWKCIQVYLKGSVESSFNNSGISLSAFLNLITKTCKLSPDQDL